MLEDAVAFREEDCTEEHTKWGNHGEDLDGGRLDSRH